MVQMTKKMIKLPLPIRNVVILSIMIQSIFNIF